MPVPLSPWMSTVAGSRATFCARSTMFTHRLARAEHELAVALLSDLGVQGDELPAQVLAFEGVPDERPQPVVVKLLGDVVVGALLHRSDRHLHLAQRGDHDHLDEAVVLPDDGQQLQAADAGQPDVQEDQVHVLPLEYGEPLLRRSRPSGYGIHASGSPSACPASLRRLLRRELFWSLGS